MNALSEVQKNIFAALNLISNDKYIEAKQIIELILKNDNYLKLISSADWQYVAGISLITGDLDLARDSYLKANNLPGTSFVMILKNNFKDAEEILKNAPLSPAKNWCYFLIKLFLNNKYIEKYLSFLTIRQFLEFTVYILLYTKNLQYLEKLLQNSKKLKDVNLDSFKFIGCAYSNFGLLDEGIFYLNKSLKENDFDGEAYFFLGRGYFKKKSYAEALSALENAKLLMPSHLPTIELINKIKTIPNS